MPSDNPSTKTKGIEFYGGFQVYSDTGVDLTLLHENLKRSPTQRLQRILGMLPLFAELSRAGRRMRGPSPHDSEQETLDAAGLFRLLNDCKVEYVLVGGLAMTVHASAYTTVDLDICYDRSASNMAKVVVALASIHPGLRGAPANLLFRFDAAALQGELHLKLRTDLGDIDLLGEIMGIGGYEQVLAQSEEQSLFDMPVRVLSLDALIAAKKAAGRLKDRNHLLELEELKKLRDANP